MIGPIMNSSDDDFRRQQESKPTVRQWTDDEVNRLIETLKIERPEMWEAYVGGETKFNAVNPKIVQWLLATSNRLFPGHTLSDVTVLVGRVRDIVRDRLGLEWPK